MSTQESFDNSDNAAGLPPLALIAGPTASGKSDVAVQLALALRERGSEGVVINADSAQVYADLAVLSARPSAEEMRGVEHRLFGAWDGGSACSAADWARAAHGEVAAAWARGAVPILVGGTGLYIRTLLDGIAPVPEIDPGVRAEVRGMETAAAYVALTIEDPSRAAQISPADTARVLRSLEVVRSTGRSLLRWQEERHGGIGHTVALQPLLILPDRAELYARCDARFEQMLERGALEEVRLLLARHLDPALPVMRAIGVPELAAHLRGELPLAQATARGQQATRNYAKRQFTWFRGQSPQDWQRQNSPSINAEAIFDILLRH